MRNPILTTLSVLVLLMAIVGTAWSGEPIDQRVEATADGILVVENVSGDVSVEGWDRNEVHVSGELGKGAERVDVSSKNGRVKVRVILPRDDYTEGTELIIKAPKGNRMEISTVSADIVVSNIDGKQRISSVSGDIDVNEARDQLEIRSVSGSLMVSASESTAESTLTTVSGDVVIKGVSGRVTGKSVSGDVLLSGTAFVEVGLASTSGDIRVSGSVGPEAVLRLKTISGDAAVLVDGNITGEFDLKTMTGDIDNCFGPKPVEPEYGPGSKLQFSDSDGDADVRITTMSGDIELCRG